MTRDEIDTLWKAAMIAAIKDNEMATRYHFAYLLLATEREACAAICEDEAKWASSVADRNGAGAAVECGYKIRARGGE